MDVELALDAAHTAISDLGHNQLISAAEIQELKKQIKDLTLKLEKLNIKVENQYVTSAVDREGGDYYGL